MKLNFKISEFNISGESIPEEIADKILHYHILPMQSVRTELGYPIYPSLKSGYRSKSWELKNGRSGNSQHTFIDKGAVDWTCNDFENNKNELLDSIIKHSTYTRIAMYNNFIHCDYKKTVNNKRQLFDSDSSSNWTFIKNI